MVLANLLKYIVIQNLNQYTIDLQQLLNHVRKYKSTNKVVVVAFLFQYYDWNTTTLTV